MTSAGVGGPSPDNSKFKTAKLQWKT